jgi:hypothetical protein
MVCSALWDFQSATIFRTRVVYRRRRDATTSTIIAAPSVVVFGGIVERPCLRFRAVSAREVLQVRDGVAPLRIAAQEIGGLGSVGHAVGFNPW